MSTDGILVVNKPAGMTSHDVILKVRRLLGIKKIGHTGTLDPDVVGVLPLCIGRGTKLVEYLQEQPKTYIAEWTAGIATDTEDASGNIIAQIENVQLDFLELIKVFNSFVGRYEQTPPMYSAVKIGGKKLYELARTGEVVERPKRTVEIYQLEILETNLDQKHPSVKFKVRCSKGTYIRTLCVDLGHALNVPAHMSDLIRIESAGFDLKNAYSLEEIEKAVYDKEWEKLLIPIDHALTNYPGVTVPEYMVTKIQNGRPILPRFPLPSEIQENELVRIISPDGKLLAIHKVIKSDEIWSKPEKILSMRE